jgi:hypothetical protein
MTETNEQTRSSDVPSAAVGVPAATEGQQERRGGGNRGGGGGDRRGGGGGGRRGDNRRGQECDFEW